MVVVRLVVGMCLILISSATSLKKYQESLELRSALSDKVTMLLPINFKVMKQGALAQKYPRAGHRPSEVYTNEKGTINIALNHTQNKATDANLPDVKKAMEAQFNRAPFMFIKSELKKMNGSQFIILEFISPAVDTMIYNLMAIASLESRLVMITFNCTEAERKEWEPMGKKIISSITLRK